ncbi:UDP binding domain-containing protein [Streptomyces xanthochromogenes]|uniref:UDP binding domain-containing protein n=1 Tax=Streptomyces xanthochromogenes TaxID=67384 RepID=UPI0038153A71
MLREASAVNGRRRQRVIDLAREKLGDDLQGWRITVWGAVFKPETDDIRDSPALVVAQALHDLGATVTITEPKALDNARKLHPELDYVEDPIAAIDGTDALLHLTEWHQYSTIDPKRLTTRHQAHRRPRHPQHRPVARSRLHHTKPRPSLATYIATNRGKPRSAHRGRDGECTALAIRFTVAMSSGFRTKHVRPHTNSSTSLRDTDGRRP